MKVGDHIQLKIQNIAHGGEGVARYDGRVFFVENALPGETVTARIRQVKKKFAKAVSLEINESSHNRIEAKCSHYGQCGGCDLQHWEYEEQVNAKSKILQDVLKHIGGINTPKVEACIASPNPWNYRNHISFSTKIHEDHFHFGFIAKDNKTLIPIEECPISDTRINEVLPFVRERVGKIKPEEKRRIRKVIVRVGSDGKAKYGFVQQGKRHIVSGSDLVMRLEGKSFYFPMEAFFQTNYAILEQMVQTIREMLIPDKEVTLLDLYAGVGFFSVLFAAEYKQIIAVEEGREAVASARVNFEKNEIENVRIQQGKVEDRLRSICKKTSPPLHILLDPPRTGLPKSVVDFLLMYSVRKLVYVSCEPSVLARDLKQLKKRYNIKRICPFDMFPQTKHLEAAVLLEPK